MTHNSKSLYLLFTVILLEGYVVLSSELLAIRLTMPFVGSGTDTISIIIAAVLMPLAFGYHAGGQFKPGMRDTWHSGPVFVTVREKLITNMLIALGFLIFALSYKFIDASLTGLLKMGLTNRIVLTTLYAGTCIAVPVYLLGQTIPLACNFFSKERLNQITGKVLFLSTVGSFLGAVISTLFLMSTIGVHNTAIINFIILGLLITLLSKNLISTRIALTWALVIAGALVNSGSALREIFIVENNQYNTIKVIEVDGERHMFMNGNASSMYSDKGQKYEYIRFIEQQVIDPIRKDPEIRDILVLGAGAFTLGIEDTRHNYDFIDIDKSLKDIAEEKVLKQKLTGNKHFHAVPARAFLTQTKKKYDVIILDVYSGAMTIPEHMITKEFFEQIKVHLKEDGKMLANMALAPNFISKISRHVDNTLRSVFPHISRHVIYGDYGLWDNKDGKINNVMYLYRHHAEQDSKTIYTDRLNSAPLDRPANRH